MTIDIPEPAGRNDIYMPMIKTTTNRQKFSVDAGIGGVKSVSQIAGGPRNIFGAKAGRLPARQESEANRPNFDIEGIIKNPNTIADIKRQAIGHHMNMKRAAYLNSTNYSKAPMVTASLSSVSPGPMRPKRNGADHRNSKLAIDLAASGVGLTSSLQQTPSPRKQLKLKMKMNPNRNTVDTDHYQNHKNLASTASDFPRY